MNLEVFKNFYSANNKNILIKKLNEGCFDFNDKIINNNQ